MVTWIGQKMQYPCILVPTRFENCWEGAYKYRSKDHDTKKLRTARIIVFVIFHNIFNNRIRGIQDCHPLFPELMRKIQKKMVKPNKVFEHFGLELISISKDCRTATKIQNDLSVCGKEGSLIACSHPEECETEIHELMNHTLFSFQNVHQLLH